MSEIVHYGISFQGKRSNNEDAILQLKMDEHTWCFAVADGMGGAEAGEIASKETLKYLEIALKADFLAGGTGNPDLKAILKKAITETQQKIKNLIAENAGLSGMGTTLTVLLIHQGFAVWANIGDSRIYLASNNQIRQITIDHTYIEQYRLENHTEVPDSIASRYGNIITRSVGGESDEADYFPAGEAALKLEEGMFFLLCSDGLITSKIADTGSEFLPYMLNYKEPQKIIRQLISKAFNDGSTDNISAIFVGIGKKTIRRTKALPVYSYPPKIDKESRYKKHVHSKMSGCRPLRLLRKTKYLLALLLSLTLLVVGYIYVKEVNYSGSTGKPVVAEEEKPSPAQLPDKPVEKKKHKLRSNETPESKMALYTQEQLQKTREASLTGISKLLISFMKDPEVCKESNPLVYIRETLIKSDKPDYIVDLHDLKLELDSAGKVVGPAQWKELISGITNAGTLPRFVNNKKYLLNKADSTHYVIIEVRDLEKVNRGNYDSDPVSFAHESGLKSLSMLLSVLYERYIRGENIKRDLSPLLQYLVRYRDGKLIDRPGKSITEGFDQKAADAVDFFIQSLKFEDGTSCIDICVPVKDKSKTQVIRFGYRID